MNIRVLDCNLSHRNGYSANDEKYHELARMWSHRSSQALLGECKWVRPLWKTLSQYLLDLNICLSCDAVIPLLGIYSTKAIGTKQVCKDENNRPKVDEFAENGLLMQTHFQPSHRLGYSDTPFGWTENEMPFYPLAKTYGGERGPWDL